MGPVMLLVTVGVGLLLVTAACGSNRAAISQDEAIKMAIERVSMAWPEVTGVENPRNPEARLMPLGEYEDRYSSGRSALDADKLVWVVQVEGESQAAGIVPLEARIMYRYAVVVMDAETGFFMMGSHSLEPTFPETGGPASDTSPTPTPIPEDSPTIACSPEHEELPCAEGTEIGKPYRFQLYTHCGIRWAYFDGRWWKASPALDDGSGNPPPGWGDPFDNGSMVLINDNLAQFTSGAGLNADFEPLPAEMQDYPGEPCL